VSIGQLAGWHAEDHARVTRPEVNPDDRRIRARVEDERAAICARHGRAAREPLLAAGRVVDSTASFFFDEADDELHRACRDDALSRVCRRALRRPDILDELRERRRRWPGEVVLHDEARS
jgi:hypothetical protein